MCDAMKKTQDSEVRLHSRMCTHEAVQEGDGDPPPSAPEYGHVIEQKQEQRQKMDIVFVRLKFGDNVQAEGEQRMPLLLLKK
ncbi:hypothetical protein PoB_004457100 [Plakobranchus ocellatus]|uniref:Uncharacterized protein n=1 Tax=Plakobranchus ocellatus TaxID=259542 RepID=A0AAV4BCB5_9GAST|nr:hypothetical protein PoB_004457100 [Plakobranchus ocellatus]